MIVAHSSVVGTVPSAFSVSYNFTKGFYSIVSDTLCFTLKVTRHLCLVVQVHSSSSSAAQDIFYPDSTVYHQDYYLYLVSESLNCLDNSGARTYYYTTSSLFIVYYSWNTESSVF